MKFLNRFVFVWLALIIITTIIAFSQYRGDLSLKQFELKINIPTPSFPTPSLSVDKYEVIKVVDGDTIDVNIDGEAKRIRLIGVDTPESVDPRTPVQCFGLEASDKTKDLLTNKNVKLEADPSQGNQDRYGRLLRYVFLEDGTFLNKTLISEGFAFEYTYDFPYKYQTEFKESQKTAESNKLGLWADNVCPDLVNERK